MLLIQASGCRVAHKGKVSNGAHLGLAALHLRLALLFAGGSHVCSRHAAFHCVFRMHAPTLLSWDLSGRASRRLPVRRDLRELSGGGQALLTHSVFLFPGPLWTPKTLRLPVLRRESWQNGTIYTHRGQPLGLRFRDFFSGTAVSRLSKSGLTAHLTFPQHISIWNTKYWC